MAHQTIQSATQRVETPWGLSDDGGTYVAPGIWFYSTPSHGGYRLDAAATRKVLAQFPGVTGFNGLLAKGWAEEDCDWAYVAKAFPDAFPPDAQAAADRTLAFLRPECR